MSPSTLKFNLVSLGKRLFRRVIVTALLVPVIVMQFGCQTATPPSSAKDTVPYSEVRLREGDIINVTFPGAPSLDKPQQIRRDGKITLSLGGEMVALGKTPSELEQEILKTYESQLAVKQVIVTVTSSSYPVFVTGAVLRPGKLMADRPMSVLDAVMEAGGFDFKTANLKKVTVLRQFEGQTISYKLDLKKTLDGGDNQPFFVKPADVIYVPEKFNWF